MHIDVIETLPCQKFVPTNLVCLSMASAVSINRCNGIEDSMKTIVSEVTSKMLRQETQLTFKSVRSSSKA